MTASVLQTMTASVLPKTRMTAIIQTLGTYHNRSRLSTFLISTLNCKKKKDLPRSFHVLHCHISVILFNYYFLFYVLVSWSERKQIIRFQLWYCFISPFFLYIGTFVGKLSDVVADSFSTFISGFSVWFFLNLWLPPKKSFDLCLYNLIVPMGKLIYLND